MGAEFVKMTPEEGAAYLVSLKEVWDKYSIRQAGLEDGRAEALAELRAEGRAEGRAEKALEMASKMKKHNELFETIALYTGLNIEQIEKS